MGIFDKHANNNSGLATISFNKKIGDLWVDTINRKFAINNAYYDALGTKKKATGKSEGFASKYMAVATMGMSSIVQNATNKSKLAKNAYDFSDLIGFEVLEDNASVTKGGLGMAAVGAITFGPTGAVVGAITGGRKTSKVVQHIVLRIDLNDLETPCLYIRLIDKPVKTKSKDYIEAYNTINNQIAILNLILRQSEQ